MRHSTLGFGLEGPLHLEIFFEVITECTSRNFLAQVFGERRLLLAPWIRTELHILRDLVEKLRLEMVVVVVVWGEKTPFWLLPSSSRCP
jgi:hypothetical protein